jgi:ribonuclease J
MQRVADLARRVGRRVGFVGRRMVDNADVALELGLLRIPEASRVAAWQMAAAPPESLALFVSGSQGEPLSALSAVARDEQKDVSVGPGDSVVLSARVIPGNERAVSRTIGNLYRRGCDVVHPGTARVHVSGHGSQQDMLELLKAVRPRHLVPVHGEYRMLVQHARLAAASGLLAADQVLLCEDGDVLVLDESGARKEARAQAGRTLLDSGAGAVEEIVVRDRRHLSSEGIVVPVIVLDKQTGRMESAPEIVTRGVFDAEERGDLLEEAGRLVAASVDSRPAEELADPALTRERVRGELRRFFRRRAQRRPVVIPVVMEV